MVIAVFDLCDTLVAENTTVGFLRRISATHLPTERALERWLQNPIFYAFGAVAQRLGRDLARERLVASLAGLSREHIVSLANDYAAELIDRCGNRDILRRLEKHRDEGDRVVILSSSLGPVVEAVAARLGVEGHGSTLGFEARGLCTGKIIRDLTGAKPALAEELRGHGNELIAYSDNRSDLALLRGANEGYAVLPAGRPKSRWAGNDVSYIEL